MDKCRGVIGICCPLAVLSEVEKWYNIVQIINVKAAPINIVNLHYMWVFFSEVMEILMVKSNLL